MENGGGGCGEWIGDLYLMDDAALEWYIEAEERPLWEAAEKRSLVLDAGSDATSSTFASFLLLA